MGMSDCRKHIENLQIEEYAAHTKPPIAFAKTDKLTAKLRTARFDVTS
jgi:hypothetical protein